MATKLNRLHTPGKLAHWAVKIDGTLVGAVQARLNGREPWWTVEVVRDGVLCPPGQPTHNCWATRASAIDWLVRRAEKLTRAGAQRDDANALLREAADLIAEWLTDHVYDTDNGDEVPDDDPGVQLLARINQHLAN